MTMLPAGTFDGRVCVVTGGGSGIGRDAALTLGRLGAVVAVLGRTRESLAETVDDIVRTGATARAYPVDIRTRDRVEEVFEQIRTELGTVRHLVNAAAGNFRLSPEDLTPGGWDAVTRIVLDGTWHCTQVAARQMIAAGAGGSIVSLGSAKAHHGGADTVHSAAAKAGVVAMTKSLAGAWGRYGIRLNLVTPGVTLGTGAVRRLFAEPGSLERDLTRTPLGRHTSTTEVSDAITYLLSDFAASATGTELVIDGGRSLGIG
ncbi:SDR family oxidoreductase [Nonomuraea wenchangensis]|uniref:SDR family oxidoreductase n=1 Tax=Nonomuraea wenchangensis TaxID=568860 RepID=UPI0034267526